VGENVHHLIFWEELMSGGALSGEVMSYTRDTTDSETIVDITRWRERPDCACCRYRGSTVSAFISFLRSRTLHDITCAGK